MIIKLHGETSLNKLGKIIKEVAEDIQARAGLESAKFKVRDCEIGISFIVDGESKSINVEHDGLKEMFKVHVKLDEKGNIDFTKDNEEESFLDGYTQSVLKDGEPVGTEEIESVFFDDELEFLEEENGGDLVAKYYKDLKEDLLVIRYYRNGILVGESAFKKGKA